MITILHIEDGADYREIIKEILNDEEIKLVGASDGPSGLALFKGGDDFDLIICDHEMPGGLTGAEVISEIRKLNKTIPIIANSSDEYFNRLMVGAGASLGLTKNLIVERLKPMIYDLINSKSTREYLEGSSGLEWQLNCLGRCSRELFR